ncbi:aminopeptidase P family protein [Blastochloris viridis]|uniref:Xaa-Pro aminopeptidase n=1 Tax=Blastochloris viridis TaxID=1079 RepID=A0A0H5B8I2_BLAVI|nr:aminopeptidase P family protein [Blastochloris viridis]ALK08223.1 Xaa-Pro dipeptidase [Blastochloris viridis]BAR98512.1 Xaa-Pro aminopeptidase [Blastochloris viridis]CUU44145.1 Xaa-Pro dipeptidase [Blastochloris viridis]
MFEARFQSFSAIPDPALGGPRLELLRAELARLGLDGFVVPRADAYQNEYVPPAEERLRWLTGFSGSAGTVVVLRERAAIFVDGRYTLQVGLEVDTARFEPINIVDRTPDAWIAANLAGGRLGYDPWLHTREQARKLAAAAKAAGGSLVAVEPNPIDRVWTDRPASPCAPVVLHPLEFAGEAASAKLDRVRAALAEARADCLLVTDPHALAWVFNIRGGDVAHTPLPLGWAMIPCEGELQLFLDHRKLAGDVRAALAEVASLAEPAELETQLSILAATGATVRLDRDSAPDRLAGVVERAGGIADVGADPIARLKAVKNAVEIAGSKAAHRRDGAAIVRFLAWLDREAPAGQLTEVAVAEALESFRRDSGLLRDISFPTIAGAGPNAALPHYRVTTATNRRVEPGILLVDSGGQYQDGTTDITRTIAIGAPTAAMRRHFTLVLKGHIAIATAVFPAGTTGAQLDPFARRALWAAGLDFDHGTGHGVGSYLSVHEGPARISRLGHTALEPGMILSNEPGYYRAGAYGIRIENLELVREVPTPAGGERPLLGFEALTLAPIDRQLVEPALLTPEEIAWLDAYHGRVAAEIGPLVDAQTAAWLAAATRPIC